MLLHVRRLRLKMKICRLDKKMSTSSPFLAALPLPSRMETHFWYVLPNEVKSKSLLRQYADLLPPFEKDHIFTMREKELRKAALLARVLVRTTIARCKTILVANLLGLISLLLHHTPQVTPESLKFRKNAHGKPEIIWKDDDCHSPSLHFNLSHTSSLIACGVTMDSPIGIDVEEKQRTTKNSITSLARRYFSCEEAEVLTAISDPEIQQREFIKLWTLKEAYVKALGRGFSGAPFNTFTIRVSSAPSNSEEAVIVVEPLDNHTNLTTNWEFAIIELSGSHYASVCRASNGLFQGKRRDRIKLTVWKTIPLVEDVCVSGTNLVVPVAGLS